MKHRFQKGQPRPEKAGRRAGIPNESSQEVGQFFREILEAPAFREKWRNYFLDTPLDLIEPKLLILAFSYGYGSPHERPESASNQIDAASFSNPIIRSISKLPFARCGPPFNPSRRLNSSDDELAEYFVAVI